MSVDIAEKNWENCVMKKLLGILILGLLTCNISFADNLKKIIGACILAQTQTSSIEEAKQICVDKFK